MGMELTENARVTLEARYLRKDGSGALAETPEELCRRVAHAVARAETRWGGESASGAAAEAFHELLTTLTFLPNSPTLMNAGTDLGQLAACFVLPVGDSLPEIFGALRDAALIHQSGGGTGFSFSRLRPAGARVGSTGGIASGPVSFMRVFDAATEAIRQGGTRRGANMGILRVDHPDVLAFVSAKDEEGALRNFNISVAVTGEFLQALAEGAEYPLHDPRDRRPSARLPAGRVFEEICLQAWRNGEPGLVFLDRINATHPARHVGEIEATNPCGEQPLLPYEACNLGSINLPKLADEAGRVNFGKLAEVVRWAIRFLDDVVEINHYPIDAVSAVTRANRKVGLGGMGFADLLLLQGIPYASQAALNRGEEVMSFIREHSLAASEELARIRGPYPNFPGSPRQLGGGLPVRNATVNTVAPTGTLSLLADTSSGIEPVFAFAYERHVLGTVLHERHPLYRRRSPGEELPDPRVFATAREVPPEWHVKMQAAFQRHVDNAVSKTINLPADATPEAVREAFLLADELGCKGLTVYRDKSRRSQVLNVCAGKCDL